MASKEELRERFPELSGDLLTHLATLEAQEAGLGVAALAKMAAGANTGKSFEELNLKPFESDKPSSGIIQAYNLTDLDTAIKDAIKSADADLIGQQWVLKTIKPSSTPTINTTQATPSPSPIASDWEPATERTRESDKAYLEQAQRVAATVTDNPNLQLVLALQSALETGFGSSELSREHGNYFGVKSKNDQAGVRYISPEYVGGKYTDLPDDFRSFAGESPSEKMQNSFAEQVAFLSNDRYGDALNYLDTPFAALAQIRLSGYATDPAYVEKLSAIYVRHHEQLAELFPSQEALELGRLRALTKESELEASMIRALQQSDAHPLLTALQGHIATPKDREGNSLFPEHTGAFKNSDAAKDYGEVFDVYDLQGNEGNGDWRVEVGIEAPPSGKSYGSITDFEDLIWYSSEEQKYYHNDPRIDARSNSEIAAINAVMDALKSEKITMDDLPNLEFEHIRNNGLGNIDNKHTFVFRGLDDDTPDVPAR